MRQQIKRRADSRLHGWPGSAPPIQARAQRAKKSEGQGFRPAVARHSLGKIAVDRKAGDSESFVSKPNTTGLAGRIKHGAENLSGISLDDVTVHYNLLRPAAQCMSHQHAKANGGQPITEKRFRKPFFRGTASEPQVVQRFEVEGKKYNEIGKLGPLVDKICGDYREFAERREHVEYWLKQYVSSYPKEKFDITLLRDYLYDDIIRQERPIRAGADMPAQELLTTEMGFRRIKEQKQAFPVGQNVQLYRTMDLEELQKLAGGSLPEEGQEIRNRINLETAKALGDHLGDYKQARSYFGGVGQALLEFTTSTDFFQPASVALPRSEKIFTPVLINVFGNNYQTSSANEGKHDDLPGLKSEKRGLYSVGLSAAAKVVFLNNVTRVRVIHLHEA